MSTSGPGADFLAGPADVLAILPAARIRAVRRQDDRQGLLDAGLGHLAEGVGQHRVPVAVAPVDRQRHAVPSQLGAERVDQRPDLGVDRADAAEVVIMLGDLLHPLAGDVPAPRHVLQKGHHVVGPLRTAEAHDQDRVVVAGVPSFRDFVRFSSAITVESCLMYHQVQKCQRCKSIFSVALRKSQALSNRVSPVQGDLMARSALPDVPAIAPS